MGPLVEAEIRLPPRFAFGRSLSMDDFEMNLAIMPRSYGVKDYAERLSGVALLAYHAT
jgi:hypothetical protein